MTIVAGSSSSGRRRQSFQQQQGFGDGAASAAVAAAAAADVRAPPSLERQLRRGLSSLARAVAIEALGLSATVAGGAQALLQVRLKVSFTELHANPCNNAVNVIKS